MYDYTIVGAGPTGLTIAWFLANNGYKVLIIERESVIGGCHRVIRVDGLFTEHSPRIYVGNANNFKYVLDNMGYNYNDIFTKSKFNFSGISLGIVSSLQTYELMIFIKEYMKFMLDSEYAKNISLKTFLENNKYTIETTNTVDAVARLTDGAGIDKYTLYEFFEIINQNMFYDIYQPKLPNDVGLFKLWYEALVNTNNVDFYMESELIKINGNNDMISSIQINNNNKIFNIDCKNCIITIPPKNLLQVMDGMDMFGPYDNYKEWAEYSEYMDFIAVTFHWSQKLKINNEWTIPNTDWLIGHTILSNEMNFNDNRSKTVISVCTTKSDGISKYIGKLPGECNEKELVDEIFRQLKIKLKEPNLINPDYSILSPLVYKKDNKWVTNDSAFIYTIKGYNGYSSTLYNNLYSVGSHNGNSNYIFTSIESAIDNAIYFVKNETNININNGGNIVTLNSVISLSSLIILLLVLYFGVYQKN